MGADPHGVVMTTSGEHGVRLTLAGELDDGAVDRLRALLDDVGEPGTTVALDLSRADRLPLGVLKALAAAHRRLPDDALTVVDPSPAAARALRTSGLHRVLRLQGWPEPAPPDAAPLPLAQAEPA